MKPTTALPFPPLTGGSLLSLLTLPEHLLYCAFLYALSLLQIVFFIYARLLILPFYNIASCLPRFVVMWILLSTQNLFALDWFEGPPPDLPGGCWHDIVPLNYRNRFAPIGEHPWISQPRLRKLVRHTHLFHKTLKGWPFVRVSRLGRNIFHVHPRNSPLGKLVHYNRLQPGWYGAGTDPTFFQDSPLYATVLALHLGKYVKQLKNAETSCPHAVPKQMEVFLKQSGISLPTAQATPHPHPVHYAFENQMLSLAAKALNNVSWYALWLNPDKVNFMQGLGCATPSDYFNPRFEAKDITRYAGTHLPVCSTPRSLNSPVWFAHDVLHHLNPSIVGSWFDSNPRLEYVFATAVIPPETVYRNGFSRLPALTPALYNYRIDGDLLTYVPEGDNGGAYIQPVNAYRWLKTSTIVSPRNRCLHVQLVHSNHAHHFFVISRHQLVPQSQRVLDMPALTVIPWYSHPWAYYTQNLYARLTLPSLMNKLGNYEIRVSATSVRDLYAKVAAEITEVYGSYPASYCRAAVQHACWLRMVDFHHSPTILATMWTQLVYLLNLPFFPLTWFWQSFTSTAYQQRYDVPMIWVTRTFPWVSSSRDPSLPGDGRDLCNPELEFSQLPPHATLDAQFARFFALALPWAFIKFSGALIEMMFGPFFIFLLKLLEFTGYMVDFDWKSTPVGFILSCLACVLGLRGPKVIFPAIHLQIIRPLLKLYGLIWFLPYSQNRFRIGLHPVYSFTLAWNCFNYLFPKFHPIVFLLDRCMKMPYNPIDANPLPTMPMPPPALSISGWHNDSSPHWHGNLSSPHQWFTWPHIHWWFRPDDSVPGTELIHYFGYWRVVNFTRILNVLCLALVLFLFLGKDILYHIRFRHEMGYWAAFGYTPIHDEENSLPSFEPYQSPPSAPPSPSVSPTEPEGPTVQPLPLEERWQPELDDPLDGPLRGPVEQPIPDPVPIVIPVPAPIPNDPLGVWNVPPRAFASLQHWQAVVNRLAVPPNALQANLSCVWECLSAHLGVPTATVWAVWCSTLPPVARIPLMGGLLPQEDLPKVLAYFNLGYELRGAQVDPNAVRGPGLTTPTIYRPEDPPIGANPATPGWPFTNLYLEQDGNRYHLTLNASPHPGASFRAPARGTFIGTPSRLVPQIEIDQVLNVPRLAFGTVYQRLVGAMRNSYGLLAAAPPVGFQNYILPAVDVIRETVVWTPNAQDAAYALHLATDIKTAPVQMNLHDMDPRSVSRRLDIQAKELVKFSTQGVGMRYGNVNLHIYHGAFGTGKSHKMIRDIRAHHVANGNCYTPATLSFHTWDHQLREQLKNDVLNVFPDVDFVAANFKTRCMPLCDPIVGTLVLDDAGKTWNSFIPLVIAANPGLTDIWLSFDVMQGQEVFGAPGISRSDPTTTEWLSPKSSNYGTKIVRTAPGVSALFGLPPAPHIPGRVVHRGSVFIVTQSPRGVPLLAVSPRFTEGQNLGGQRAHTFGEVQGHTIHGDVCVDLGGLTATATEAYAWNALTRATGNIYLKMGPILKADADIEGCWAKSQILSSILTVASMQRKAHLTVQDDPQGLIRAAVYSHMSSTLSPAAAARLGLPAPNPVVGTRATTRAPIRTDWLHQAIPSSDLYTARTHQAVLTGNMSAPSAAFSRHTAQFSHPTTGPVADIVRHFTPLHAGSVLQVESTTYHLPADQHIDLQEDPVHHINEPADDVLREIAIPDGSSSFQHVPDGAPDTLHHTRADRVTDLAGMQKRIKLGTYNGRMTRTDAERLRQLKKGFGKFFDVDAWNSTPLNYSLLEECESRKLASWASKRTKTALAYSIKKQSLDMPLNRTRLFPKGQYIKKWAKVGRGSQGSGKHKAHAFASQTVSDFSLLRIFRDCTYALYLESMVLRFAYDSTYLHCRASPDDLSNWYRKHWSPGVMTANDYTAWDSGCDHVFLAFDLWLMELCHFPAEYMDKYYFEKTRTYSHLGNHLPRQESGDRWTWILNTARNAALTGASLDAPKRTPLCVSGDDSVTLGAWRKASNFDPSTWLMQPKREEAKHVEFCGLTFGGKDVSFAPDVVYWRSRFGLQQGRSDPDYWRSIRDSINESQSRLELPSSKLAAARANLDRAIIWFRLSPTLSLPRNRIPQPYTDVPSHHIRSLLHNLLFPIRWLFFL
uniref:RdRp n=1 Tax=Agave tequilana deltaflexivirus 1 TaxID=2794415 RepID=A0A7T5QZB3_9VIRU|nr:RdRp [Agave tequilana deltaflexivirus 1]